MKSRRVIVLCHADLVPPENAPDLAMPDLLPFKTEYDVSTALRDLGHEVQIVGMDDDLAPLRRALRSFKPHVVFNLLEEFHNEAIFDAYIVGYLELTRTPYTGCNPRGLVLARDKALSKKILAYHRVRVPRFAVFARHKKVRRPKSLEFPVIVKSLLEEASEGISQASVVTNDNALKERVAFIHEKVQTDAVVEQYIDGRELYSAVLGNHRLQVMTPWELILDNLPESAPRIATRKIKWDLAYQKKHKIRTKKARDLSEEVQRHIVTVSRRVCRRLGLNGYVRIDFRLSPEGTLFFIEANPNPDISYGGEFAEAAEAMGIGYEDLLQKIVSLGIRRAKAG